MEIPLLLERRAPVPHAREASVDAAPRIIEIVRAAPVERVPEKVAEDLEVSASSEPYSASTYAHSVDEPYSIGSWESMI
jgi:hypothetical protein